VVHTTTAEGNRKDHHEITNRTTSGPIAPDVRQRDKPVADLA